VSLCRSLCGQVIWANHNMRAAVSAMKETSKTIFESQSLTAVEPKVAAVNEVFRLQGMDELKKADKKYLPQSSSK
jgi:phosphoenolpyruvate phosphomutase